MRVAEDDDVGFLTSYQIPHLGAGGAGIEDVAQHEFEAAKCEDFNLTLTEVIVAVALDGGHRGNPLEAEQHGRGANVSRVQNVVDAREELGDLVVEEAVRVRDDADGDPASIETVPRQSLSANKRNSMESPPLRGVYNGRPGAKSGLGSRVCRRAGMQS